MTHPDLFSYVPPVIMGDRQGETFNRTRDLARLNSLMAKVWLAMSDHQWTTLAELHCKTGGSEASCSARIRDLRKSEFGGFTVERRFVRRGLFEYRLVG